MNPKITRRQFLVCTGGSVFALGAVAETATLTTKARIGIVGLGSKGIRHLDLLSGRPDVEVTAIVDQQRSRLRSAIDRCGILQSPIACRGLSQLHGLPVDGVVVDSTRWNELEATDAATASGCHVFLTSSTAFCTRSEELEALAGRTEAVIAAPRHWHMTLRNSGAHPLACAVTVPDDAEIGRWCQQGITANVLLTGARPDCGSDRASETEASLMEIINFCGAMLGSITPTRVLTVEGPTGRGTVASEHRATLADGRFLHLRVTYGALHDDVLVESHQAQLRRSFRFRTATITTLEEDLGFWARCTKQEVSDWSYCTAMTMESAHEPLRILRQLRKNDLA